MQLDFPLLQHALRSLQSCSPRRACVNEVEGALLSRAEQWPEMAPNEAASDWLRRTGGYNWRKLQPSVHSSSAGGSDSDDTDTASVFGL